VPRLPLASLIFSSLSLFALPSFAEAKPCAINTESASVNQVRIRAGKTEPFTVQVRKLPAQVTPGAKGAATLLVESPLRFSTEHPMNKLGLELSKRTPLADGRIVLARGLTPRFIDRSEVEESGPLPVKLPLSELTVVTPLALPCSALRLPKDADSSWSPGLDIPEKRVIDHVVTSEEISLYARPEKVDPLRIKFGGPLTVVATRGAWVRLRAKWSDGSVLKGWVPKSEVSVLRKDPEYEGHGYGGMRGICGGGHRPTPVPFKLRSHAPIHEAAGGEIWAHTAGIITVKALSLSRSDGWMQIIEVEGFPAEGCSRHDRFWVHADNVLWTGKPLRD
jgi:hypothetical protein